MNEQELEDLSKSFGIKGLKFDIISDPISYNSHKLHMVLPLKLDIDLRTGSATGEVISKSNSTKIITLKTTIMNEKDDYLINGEAKVVVRE